jgi:hypothetical protein
MNRSLIALCALIALVASNAGANAVWVSDGAKLHGIDPSTNRVTQSVRQEKPATFATAKDGTLWMLDAQELKRLRSSGGKSIEWEVRGAAPGGLGFLSLDARGSSVWVAQGEVSSEVKGAATAKRDVLASVVDDAPRRIVRLNNEGHKLAQLEVTGPVRGIAQGTDGALWVLGAKALWHFNRDGSIQSTAELKQLGAEKSTLLAADNIGAWLWIAENDTLIRLDGTKLAAQPSRIKLEGKPIAMGVDVFRGTLWVATATKLTAYHSNGTVKHDVFLPSLEIGLPTAMAVDNANAAVWLAHGPAVTRFSLAGNKVATIPFDRAVTAAAPPPPAIYPVVLLVLPDTELVTQSQPTIRLKYEGGCVTEPCTIDPAYMDTFELQATLNGQDVQEQFTYDPVAKEATLVPWTPLPDGVNVITVQVTDGFGVSSDPVNNQFIVDTGPPLLSGLTPPSPSAVANKFITIEGALSEESEISFTGMGVNFTATGAMFSFPVTLQSGNNTFVLTATDTVGNTATFNLSYVLDGRAPDFLSVTPVSNSAFTSATVEIRAQVDEYSIIKLSGNGVYKEVTGQQLIHTVTLQAGANDFAIIARDAAGNFRTRNLRYTLGNPVSVLVTSPANGATTNDAKVTVTGTFQSVSDTAINVNGVVASIVGNAFVANVPLSPGVNTLTISASAQDGSSATQSLAVTSTGATNELGLFVDKPTGIAPHEVSVTVPRMPGETYARLEADFAGNVVQAYGFGGRAQYVFASPGVYQVTMKLFKANGDPYPPVTQTVIVRSVVEMNSMMQKSMSTMRAHLQNSDLTSALQHFAPAVRDQYRAVFEGLSAPLSTVGAQLGTIVDGRISEEFAEYVIVRDKPTGKQAYYIYLMPGDDGIWRIVHM